MSDPKASGVDIDAAFEAFVDGQAQVPSSSPSQSETEPGSDPLVVELNGGQPSDAGADPSDPAPSEPSVDSGQVALPGDEVYEQLRRARQDHRNTADNLHEERQRNEGLQAQVEFLSTQMAALQNGQPPVQPNPVDAQPVAQVTDQQLDAFMQQVDPNWGENSQDPLARLAARYAVMISREGVQYTQQMYQGLQSRVEDSQFSLRLQGLGIDRTQFDQIWAQPGREWAQALTNDQKLAALESEVARMPGGRPSAPAPNRAPGGAPTAPSVDPRTHVEQDHGGHAGTTTTPTQQAGARMQEALRRGDTQAVNQAAESLFSQFYNQ